MKHFNSLADIRREYGELTLSEQAVSDDPLVQFKLWLEDVLNSEKNDPTAMVLSTVDSQGHPDSRVVLLKGIEHGAFVFYTNYHSTKAQHMDTNPYVALNFFWPQMARQVRIRGRVKKVSSKKSDAYFASRPAASQLSAIASPQSQPIESREHLEKAINQLIEQYGQELVMRPKHWGGYEVTPYEIEFWQGRDNRLHDRIQYTQDHGQWRHCRLAP